MNVRSSVFMALALLGTGCSGDIRAFLGTYDVSGTESLNAAGSTASQPLSGTMRIVEGISSDVLLSTGHGCVLPADVEGDRLILKAGTTCTETRNIPDQGVHTFEVRITQGTGMREDSRLRLDYEAIVKTDYEGVTYSGQLVVRATLDKTEK